MAETKNVHVNVDLGIRRLLVIPVLVGFLLLAVLVYGYTSIVGNERLSLVVQGLAIAREMEVEQTGWDQFRTGDWVMRFIDMANSQGNQESEISPDADAVTRYVKPIDNLLTGWIRRGVHERVKFEVQTNYLRNPKDVDPYKLLEAAWKGMLMQYTVLKAITPTPTPSSTPEPEEALAEPTVVTAQPGQASCPVEWCNETVGVPVGEIWDFPNSCFNPFKGKPDFSVNCRPADTTPTPVPTPVPAVEGSSSWPTTSVVPTPTPTPMQTFSPTPAFRLEKKDLITQALDSWVDDGLPEEGFWFVAVLVLVLVMILVGVTVYYGVDPLFEVIRKMESVRRNLEQNE